MPGVEPNSGDGGNRTHERFPPSSGVTAAYWDDRRRLAGLAVLVLRDNVAQGLRRLADLIEVPDPYLPKFSSASRRHHGSRTAGT